MTARDSEDNSADPSAKHRDVAAKVLVVDDDEGARRATAALLCGATDALRFASSGAEALELARSWHPDVILLDVMMPEIDGFEVCRRLRADPLLSDVRVFMLTALDDSQSRLKGFDAGADDFITKPLDRAEAQLRIHSVAKLNRYRALIADYRRLQAIRYVHVPSPLLEEMERDALELHFNTAMRLLRLVAQPIVHAPPSSAPGMFAREVLLRTDEPHLSDPDTLIAAAAMLGREVELFRAIRTLVGTHMDKGTLDGLVFVNLNASELNDPALYESACPLMAHADRVVIEITEREPVESIRGVRAKVAALRQFGFRFALDDFGAGYASLNSFAVIEPEFVKLDRNILQGVLDERLRQRLVTSMVNLCDELGIEVIAEGVETNQERDALMALGCRFLQGYALGRPARIRA
ncbi:MAG: EAL domain-containing response regulator [Gammaproteobacteria bacterium]|nr:EAL domain-containing response regulator [Gammaproteobacteria bacterium]MDH3466143.1 EAL domain-containing response regulator [Gammaproteobacteria bacterium]